MATLPWRTISSIEPDNDYTAMLTYLPLGKRRTSLRFFKYITQITKQLHTTPGLKAYSMRAKPMAKDYWTLSIWENNDVINQYVATAPHIDIMKRMSGLMGATDFKSWEVKGHDLPLNWDDVIGPKTS